MKPDCVSGKQVLYYTNKVVILQLDLCIKSRLCFLLDEILHYPTPPSPPPPAPLPPPAPPLYHNLHNFFRSFTYISTADYAFIDIEFEGNVPYAEVYCMLKCTVR